MTAPRLPIAITLPQAAGAAGILVAALIGVMAGQDPKLGVALIVAAAYVPLAMISLPAALACWVSLVFVERAGFGLAGTFAGLLVLAAWLGTVSARRAALRYALYRHRWILTVAVLLVAWLGLSTAWSQEPGTGEIVQYFLALIAFFVVATTPSRPRHMWIVAAGFVAGAVLIVLVGIAQGGLRPTGDAVATDDGYGGRLASGGMDPNYLAAGMVPAIALAAALMGRTRDPIKRLALLIAIAVCGLGLATTQSRGGLVAAAVALLVAIVISKGRRLQVLAVTLLLLGALGSWFVIDQAAWERVSSNADGGTGRTELWNVAWQMSGDHPVVGVGLDQFRVRAADYSRQTGSLEFSEFLTEDPKVVHNLYLQTLAETGVIGLFLLLAVIAAAMRTTWLAIRRLDATGSALADLGRAIFVAQVAMLTASAFLSNGNDKRIWILLAFGPALMTVAARMTGSETEAAEAAAVRRRRMRFPVGGLAGGRSRAGRLLPRPSPLPAPLPMPALPRAVPAPAALRGTPTPPRPRSPLRAGPSRAPVVPGLSSVPEDVRRRLEPAALRLPAVAALVTGLFLGWIDAGFQATTWYPSALFLLALLVLVVVLAAPARGTIERPFAIALAAFGAFTAWGFLSMLWAEIPADAWEGANRTLLFFVVIALVGLRPWPPALGTAALGVIGGGVALIGVFTLLRGDEAAQLFLGGRLGEPAGYPNAAAAMWLIGFWPALHVALMRRLWPAVRGAGLAAATLLLGLALLSQSRGAAIGFAATALVFVLLHTRRWPALLGLATTTALVGLAWDPLVDVRLAANEAQLQDRFDSASSALLISAAAAFAIGTLVAYGARLLWGEGGVPRRARRAGDRAILGVAGVALVATLIGLVMSSGWIDQRWTDFRDTDYGRVEGERTRFTGSLGSGRYDFYRVALNEFKRNPVGGVGADNFSVDYLMERETAEAPRYAHSLAFGVLAQLGAVGALLLGVFVAAMGWAILRVRRREGEVGGAVAVAGLAAFLAWSIHGMTDWLWEFPALSMLALGAFVVGARVRSQPPRAVALEPYGPPVLRRRAIAVAGALLTIAAAISLSLPGAAVRVERSAYEIQREDPGGALARLLRAGDLNPLSADPMLARAVLARRLGQDAVAASAIAEAVRREDRNWLMQFEAGLFAAEQGDRTRASAALRRAHELNPGQPVIEDVRRRLARGEEIDANEAEQALSGQLQQKLRPVDDQ